MFLLQLQCLDLSFLVFKSFTEKVPSCLGKLPTTVNVIVSAIILKTLPCVYNLKLSIHIALACPQTSSGASGITLVLGLGPRLIALLISNIQNGCIPLMEHHELK